MSESLAKAHTRSEHQYSWFHLRLIAKQNSYALRHVYSTENAVALLQDKKLLTEHVKTLQKHLTIDVWQKLVWVRLPKWISATVEEQENWLIQNPKTHRIIDGQKCRHLAKGFSRFISKTDFIEALLRRNQQQADPQKLSRLNPFVYEYWGSLQGQGRRSTLNLEQDCVTCNCTGYEELHQAFLEDSYLLKKLKKHPILGGQLPDRHVLAIWEKMGVKDFCSYQWKFWQLQIADSGIRIVETAYHCYRVWAQNQEIGTVFRRMGKDTKPYWKHEHLYPQWQNIPGDGVEHETIAAAAIALAEFVRQIETAPGLMQQLDPLIGVQIEAFNGINVLEEQPASASLKVC